MRKNVWAFDLSSHCGIAKGFPPENGDLSLLDSMTVDLQTKRYQNEVFTLAHIAEAFESWWYWATKDEADLPDLIAFEAPMPAAAKPRDNRPRNPQSLMLPSNLSSRLIQKAWRKDIPVEMIWPATIRAAFIGKTNAGDRKATKRAVIDRCKEWGYLPAGCNDDNRADACAIWHVAQVKFAQWQPPFELMMGRRVPIAR